MCGNAPAVDWLVPESWDAAKRQMTNITREVGVRDLTHAELLFFFQPMYENLVSKIRDDYEVIFRGHRKKTEVIRHRITFPAFAAGGKSHAVDFFAKADKKHLPKIMRSC